MRDKTLDFSEIKRRVPIDTALSHYGVTLNASGAKLHGCCPIHGGSNPRAFTVSADRRVWYCLGDCARGGSVLDLVAALEDCTIVEAGEILIKRFGTTKFVDVR